jgi:hypothetical protein
VAGCATAPVVVSLDVRGRPKCGASHNGQGVVMRLAWHFILPNADRLCVVVAQYFPLLRSHQEFVPCGACHNPFIGYWTSPVHLQQEVSLL